MVSGTADPTPSSNGSRTGGVLESRDEEEAMTVVKAAAVQLSPVLYSREGTVDKVVRKIRELGREGVQFGRASCRERVFRVV